MPLVIPEVSYKALASRPSTSSGRTNEVEPSCPFLRLPRPLPCGKLALRVYDGSADGEQSVWKQ